jgi:hypothetical protein
MSSGQFWKDAAIFLAKEAWEKTKFYATYLLGNTIFGPVQSYWTVSLKKKLLSLEFFQNIVEKS